MKGKARAAVYGMAGFYLLFLSYNMLKDRINSEGAEYIILLIAIVLFVILGIALLVISYKMLRKPTQEREEHDESED